MDYVLLVIVGFVAGISAGLLGIGGSVVMIPGLVLIFGGNGQHLYQAAAMIANFFVIAPAVLRHWRVKAMLWPVIRLTIPSSIVGAVAGVYASDLPVFRRGGQGYLQIAFAAFLVYVVVYNLWRLRPGAAMRRAAEAGSPRLSSSLIVLLVGLPAGLLAGLLGIGGGLFAVPAQQIALRIRLPNAIANSAATILCSSIVGAAVKNHHLAEHGFGISQSVMLAACLIPSAMIGSWVAAAKVHQWPVSAIRVAFVIVLAYSAVKVFLAGWGQVGAL
jgi:uncharacterized membrane protein YfcA